MKLELAEDQFAFIVRGIALLVCEECAKRRMCIRSEVVDSDGETHASVLCRPCLRRQLTDLIEGFQRG